MKYEWKKWLLLPLLLALGLAAQAGVLVVTSENSSLSQLNHSQVRQLFTGRLHEVGGQKLVPLDLPEHSKVRGHFYKSLTGRNARQMRAYWTQLIFTGRGTPPQVYSRHELVRHLKNNPGLVGYLSSKASTRGLKVLAMLN